MNALNLFVDTTTGTGLISGLNSPRPVDPFTLPFLVGGYLPLNIYLMNKTETTLSSYNPYIVIPNYGLTLVVYINDGTFNGVQYTMQVSFTQDPGGQFFSASLAMNTAGLEALLATATTAQPWLMIAYFDQAGNFVPCLTVEINIIPGAPVATTSVPPGLTPLSLEQADGRYLQVSGPPGQGFVLTSPLGKQFLMRVVDLPGGGAEWQMNPIN